jgi:hypothetical protein
MLALRAFNIETAMVADQVKSQETGLMQVMPTSCAGVRTAHPPATAVATCCGHALDCGALSVPYVWLRYGTNGGGMRWHQHFEATRRNTPC